MPQDPEDPRLSDYSIELSDVTYPAQETSDTELVRENTARWLGLGVGVAFGLAMLAICVAHFWTLSLIIESCPKEADPAAMEQWFRWQAQVGEVPKDLAQTVGTLLAGPFGVVLGFYFRDRNRSR